MGREEVVDRWEEREKLLSVYTRVEVCTRVEI